MSYDVAAQSSSFSNRSVMAPIVPVTARGESTRRKLLDAAEREFGEKGYHTASVSSITTRANVGQGTFYLYFHTKEEIFITLVREIGHALRKHMALAISKVKPRMAAERAGLESFFEFAHQHPGLYRIVQECQFVDGDVFRDYYERLAQGYAQGLSAAAEKGEVSPGDAEVRAWSIMGMGHFVGMRHCIWKGQAPTKEVVDDMMALIADGMAPSVKPQRN